MRKKKIRRTFEEEKVPVEYRALLELWGAGDCVFSIEEVALLTKKTKEDVKSQIATLKKDYPQAYKFYAARRQHLRRQNDFEDDNTKRLGSDFMDEEFSWTENTTEDLPTAAQRDIFIKAKLTNNERTLEKED